MKNPILALFSIVIMTSILPLAAQAKELPNKVKALQTKMKACTAEAKKYSSLGYPEKADAQIKQCTKIKADLAKIKQAQEKTNRKIASLNESGSASSTHASKHNQAIAVGAPAVVVK